MTAWDKWGESYGEVFSVPIVRKYFKEVSLFFWAKTKKQLVVNTKMSKQDKKFISAIVFAGVGVICLAFTYSMEMAVYRIRSTLDHKLQIHGQMNKLRYNMREYHYKKQGFKPLKDLIKEDKQINKQNEKTKEVL